MNATAQPLGSAGLTKVFNAGAFAPEHVEGQIDAIKLAVIQRTVLQVVDDLQCRADGVRSGSCGAWLSVHVEHETADRHGGIGAIVHQLQPAVGAVGGGVLPEGLQQGARVAIRQASLRQDRSQFDSFRVLVRRAVKARLKPIQHRELVGRRQRGMVRHIIRRAGEMVECKNGFAMFGRQQQRGYGEVFVPIALARAQICGAHVSAPPLGQRRDNSRDLICKA